MSAKFHSRKYKLRTLSLKVLLEHHLLKEVIDLYTIFGKIGKLNPLVTLDMKI